MKTRKLTTMAMLTSIGIIFQIIEGSIPLPFVVPGFKLGLANIVGLIALYKYGTSEMIGINFLRVFIAALLRGTLLLPSFYLSLAGMILSTIATILGKNCKIFSIYGVSILGSAFHAVGQVIMISFLYQQFYMQALLPILVILAIPTGILTATIALQVQKRIR